MLLTPTMIGSVVAGVACWLLFWYGISHVDSISYLNQYVSRKMIMDWIRKNPQLALIITELINVGMHGLGHSMGGGETEIIFKSCGKEPFREIPAQAASPQRIEQVVRKGETLRRG